MIEVTDNVNAQCHSLFILLKKHGVLKQSILAAEMGVSQSTVSNLMNSKDLNEQRVIGLVELLVDKAKAALDVGGLAVHDKALVQQKIKGLSSYIPYKQNKKKGVLGDCQAPLSGVFSNYVIRRSDKEVAHCLAKLPMDVLIFGGPKTGKSSTLIKACEDAEKRTSVIKVDFGKKAFQRPGACVRAVSFLQNFSEEIESNFPLRSDSYRPVLKDVVDFSHWFEDSVLHRAKRPVILALDNLHVLDKSPMETLLACLKQATDFRFRRPLFDKFSLVVTSAAIDTFVAREIPSLPYFFSSCKIVQLAPFTDFELMHLADVWLCKNARQFVEKAMELFGGHPYLAHIFFAELKKTELQNGMDGERIEHAATVCKRYLVEKILNYYGEEQGSPAGRNECGSEGCAAPDYQRCKHRMKYYDQLLLSGLYKWKGSAVEDGVELLSTWLNTEDAESVAESLGKQCVESYGGR